MRPDEVIVVYDFKMKILPTRLNEIKREFFGKRGTACLGFMILTNIEGKVGEVDVNFIFLFSDDTTQDANFVAAGKHYIYSEFLPSIFPAGVKIKAYAESDAAGALNCNLAKSLMPWWSVWTNGRVEEVQIRISVNGDGKTTLDGAFGKLGQNLRDAVNNGLIDILNAETILEAYQKGAGIKGAVAAVLILDRNFILQNAPKAKEPQLLSSHRLVLDRKQNQIMSYGNSGYGNGIPVSLKKVKDMFSSPPSAPQYTITLQAENINSLEASVHPTESHQSRIKSGNLSKRQTRDRELEIEHQTKIQTAKEKGLFKCDVRRDIDGATCRYACQSAAKLEEHKTKGVHMYPSMDVVDSAVDRAFNSMLCAGGRSNRSEAYANADVKDGTGAGIMNGEAWCHEGCYRKPPRAAPKNIWCRVEKNPHSDVQ